MPTREEELIRRLTRSLRRYVQEDDTQEGGHWEVDNEYWLDIKREAESLLEEVSEEYPHLVA